MTTRRAAVSIGLLASAVWGCGSGGGDPPPPRATMSFASFCQALVQAEVGVVATCARWNPDDLAAGAAGFCPTAQRELTLGLIAYDASQAEACLAAVRTPGCGSLAASGRLPPECTRAMAGTRQLNGACYEWSECAEGYCTAAGATCPGSCKPFAQATQACSAVPCAAGLACDFTAPAPTCKVPSGSGGTCPCQEGLWCDTAVGRCKAQQTGGTCDTTIAGQCALGYSCIGSSCQQYSVTGGSCSLTTGPECGPGYRCVGGTCAPLPGPGQGCVDQCIGGYCNLAAMPPVCVAAKVAGAACTSDGECASGTCSGTSHTCADAAVCYPP